MSNIIIPNNICLILNKYNFSLQNINFNKNIAYVTGLGDIIQIILMISQNIFEPIFYLNIKLFINNLIYPNPENSFEFNL